MAVVSVGTVFTLFLIFHGGSCDLDYSYHGCKGPSHWPKLYPDCGAPNQSPIDLNTNKSKTVEPRTDGEVIIVSERPAEDYEVAPYYVKITNNGHTASMKLIWEGRVTDLVHLDVHVQGRGDDLYELVEIQFRWGPNDSVGSEHTLNSKRYSLEAQAIFATYDHKIVVFSVLYKKSEEDNPALAALASTLSQVVEAGSSAVSADPVNLYDLLPFKPRRYRWYIGSLTSPPCTGDVLWLVDYRSMNASGREVEAFRKLKDKHGRLIDTNCRPQQPQGDRVVYQDLEW